MKYSGMFAFFAATICIFAAGCGGGGSSSNSGTRNVQGEYSGSFVSQIGSRAAGRPSQATNLYIDFTQTGTSLGGTALFIVSPTFYSGTISGSISGSSLNITINGGANGTTSALLTVNGTSISGNYSTTLPNGGGTTNGTVSLSQQVGQTTAVLPATLVGTSQSNAASGPKLGLSVNFVQTGDSLTVSGLSGSPPNNGITGSGTIIGNTVAFQVTQGTTNVTYYFGTVSTSGTTVTGVTGTFYQPGTNSGNNGVPVNGTFTLSLPTS